VLNPLAKLIDVKKKLIIDLKGHETYSVFDEARGKVVGSKADRPVGGVDAVDLDFDPGQKRRVIVKDRQFGCIGHPGLFEGRGRKRQLDHQGHGKNPAGRAGGLATAPMLKVHFCLRAPGGICSAVW